MIVKIAKHRRRKIPVKESLFEIYLAGISLCRVKNIIETSRGTKVSPSNFTIKPMTYRYLTKQATLRYVLSIRVCDGIFLKPALGGKYTNTAILIAIGVNKEDNHEILGTAEGMNEYEENKKIL